MTKFEIEAHILEDGIVILKVVGELELIGSRGYASPSTPALRFQRTIRKLDAEGRKWMVMDCTGLRIIDLCGYNVVLECWDRMRRAGGGNGPGAWRRDPGPVVTGYHGAPSALFPDCR